MIINFNKPKGPTSFKALSEVRKILGAKKAGHAGTLDPMASGVLIILTGKDTKAAGIFSNLDKEYEAVLKLGERTDTFDAEGKIIARKPVSELTAMPAGRREEKIKEILSRFEGKIIQKVPIYSAVKVKGKRLYKLARKGETPERPEREVSVNRIELLEFKNPFLKIKVSCSKGTYIRTLADDIGAALGTFAHLTELTRTAIGPFRLENSCGYEDLKISECRPISPDAIPYLETPFPSKEIR